MSRPLEIAACRAACRWLATGDRRGTERLFACEGCGSEWVVSEPWTPVDLDGAAPEAVQEERAARRRGLG